MSIPSRITSVTDFAISDTSSYAVEVLNAALSSPIIQYKPIFVSKGNACNETLD